MVPVAAGVVKTAQTCMKLAIDQGAYLFCMWAAHRSNVNKLKESAKYEEEAKLEKNFKENIITEIEVRAILQFINFRYAPLHWQGPIFVTWRILQDALTRINVKYSWT